MNMITPIYEAPIHIPSNRLLSSMYKSYYAWGDGMYFPSIMGNLNSISNELHDYSTKYEIIEKPHKYYDLRNGSQMEPESSLGNLSGLASLGLVHGGFLGLQAIAPTVHAFFSIVSPQMISLWKTSLEVLLQPYFVTSRAWLNRNLAKVYDKAIYPLDYFFQERFSALLTPLRTSSITSSQPVSLDSQEIAPLPTGMSGAVMPQADEQFLIAERKINEFHQQIAAPVVDSELLYITLRSIERNLTDRNTDAELWRVILAMDYEELTKHPYHRFFSELLSKYQKLKDTHPIGKIIWLAQEAYYWYSFATLSEDEQKIVDPKILYTDRLLSLIESNEPVAFFKLIRKNNFVDDKEFADIVVFDLVLKEEILSETLAQAEEWGMVLENSYPKATSSDVIEFLKMISDEDVDARSKYDDVRRAIGSKRMNIRMINSLLKLIKDSENIHLDKVIDTIPDRDIPFGYMPLLVKYITSNDVSRASSMVETLSRLERLPSVLDSYIFAEARYIGDKGEITRHGKVYSQLLLSGNVNIAQVWLKDLLRIYLRAGNAELISYVETLYRYEKELKRLNTLGTGDTDVSLNQLRSYALGIQILDLIVSRTRGDLGSVGSPNIVSATWSETIAYLESIAEHYGISSDSGSLIYSILESVLPSEGYQSIEQVISAGRVNRDRASERNKSLSERNQSIPDDEVFIHGMKVNSPYYHLIFDSGLVAADFFGAKEGYAEGLTPFDADGFLVENDIREFFQSGLQGKYGPIFIAFDPFINSELLDLPQTSKSTDIIDYELFKTGVASEKHWGIRTGIAATEIKYIYLAETLEEKDIEALFFHISANDIYIPVYDKDFNLIFSFEDYQQKRQFFGAVGRLFDNNNANITIDYLRSDPYLDYLYSLDTRTSQKTVANHTINVLNNFDNRLAPRFDNQILSRSDMRLLLALHDIGKGLPGSETQYEKTMRIVPAILNGANISLEKRRVISAIIDQDILGEYIENRVKTDSREVATKIRHLSIELGVETEELFKLLAIYLLADGGSYQEFRSSFATTDNSIHFTGETLQKLNEVESVLGSFDDELENLGGVSGLAMSMGIMQTVAIPTLHAVLTLVSPQMISVWRTSLEVMLQSDFVTNRAWLQQSLEKVYDISPIQSFQNQVYKLFSLLQPIFATINSQLFHFSSIHQNSIPRYVFAVAVPVIGFAATALLDQFGVDPQSIQQALFIARQAFDPGMVLSAIRGDYLDLFYRSNFLMAGVVQNLSRFINRLTAQGGSEQSLTLGRITQRGGGGIIAGLAYGLITYFGAWDHLASTLMVSTLVGVTGWLLSVDVGNINLLPIHPMIAGWLQRSLHRSRERVDNLRQRQMEFGYYVVGMFLGDVVFQTQLNKADPVTGQAEQYALLVRYLDVKVMKPLGVMTWNSDFFRYHLSDVFGTSFGMFIMEQFLNLIVPGVLGRVAGERSVRAFYDNSRLLAAVISMVTLGVFEIWSSPLGLFDPDMIYYVAGAGVYLLQDSLWNFAKRLSTRSNIDD